MSSEFGDEKQKFGELKNSEHQIRKETDMNEEKFDFEKLKVYQKALDYVDFVYEITRRFPNTEIFSLSDQFKRASLSIPLNIAEGSGGSKVEFKRGDL